MASRLLAELYAAGLELTRDEDRLHYRTRSGVSIAPFRDVITAHKLELLAALEWYEAVTVCAGFDRERADVLYDRLTALERAAEGVS